MPKKTEYLWKLQELYREKTGDVLTEEQAEEYFELLIGLVQATYQSVVISHGATPAARE